MISTISITSDEVQEYILFCKMTQSNSITLPQMRKCESYFEKFKKTPNAMEMCICVLAQANVSNDSTILFSAQILRQVCMSKGCPAIHDEIVASLINNILYYFQSNSQWANATMIQLLLGIASILTRRIISSGGVFNLKTVVEQLLHVNGLPARVVVEVLGMIPENINIKHYHKRCTSAQLVIAVHEVYVCLLRDVCDILNMIVNSEVGGHVWEKSAGRGSLSQCGMTCISNWMQFGLDISDSGMQPGAIPAFTAAAKCFLSYELTVHVLHVLDAQFSRQTIEDIVIVNPCIDYISAFCEASVVATHEVGVSLACNLLPLLVRWLKCQLGLHLTAIDGPFNSVCDS